MCVVAACGGKPVANGPGNTGHATPAAGTAAAMWSKVLVKGKAVTLRQQPIEGVESGADIVATVTDVSTANGVTTAQVSWKHPDGSDVMQLPRTIVVSATEVKLDDMVFPVSLANTTLPSGLYVKADKDSVCYGSGPPPGTTEECADVCDADLCIDADGFSGGLGTFWPNYMVFERR